MSKPVLYRCKVPTNHLCACGRVARALKKADIDFETRRVNSSKKKRPEIVELTAQNRVPVLVDGDEIIHDSRRVTEYLEQRPATR